MFDGKALGDQLTNVVKDYVSRALGAIGERITSLEKRISEMPVAKDGKDGINGKDGSPGQNGVDGKDGRDGVDGKDGINGKDGSNGPHPDWVLGEIAVAVAKIPDPKDGKDGLPGRDGKDGKDGINGKDADQEFIRAEVVKAVSAIPQPKNGDKGIDGRDGRDGKDGRDGFNGKDATEIDPLAGIDEQRSYPIGTWAKHNGGLWLARANTKGMDGWDNIIVGLASVDVEPVGERGFVIRCATSDGQVRCNEFAHPALLDRGVYKAEEPYVKGDVTTWDGSMWIAQKNTTDKPGTSDAWRLSVKKGRDGRDGLKGEKGERGAEGRSGKDMTQLGPDGSKW